MIKTRISSEGEVAIPKEIRDRHGWAAGVELEIKDGGDAVVLRRPAPERQRLFPPTRLEDVIGCVKWDGPPVTIEEMDEGVARGIREMWKDFERQSRDRR